LIVFQVTHGITYLPEMDNIVVIKDGKISEVGTYKELLAQKGAFAEVLVQFLSAELEETSDDGLADLELLRSVIVIVLFSAILTIKIFLNKVFYCLKHVRL
jgi:ABC-type multidrug transport system ATPase subunit